MTAHSVQSADRIVLGLLGVSLVANVILGVLTLRPSAGSRVGDRPPRLGVGTSVASLSGKDLSGNSREVSLTGGVKTILYAFTASCPWCKRNLPNLRALSRGLTSEVRILALALEDDPEIVKRYIKEYAFPVTDVLLPDAATRGRLRLGPVPETMVFGERGVLEHIWEGAYSSANAGEIGRVFAVSLPGLATSPDSPDVMK